MIPRQGFQSLTVQVNALGFQDAELPLDARGEYNCVELVCAILLFRAELALNTLGAYLGVLGEDFLHRLLQRSPIGIDIHLNRLQPARSGMFFGDLIQPRLTTPSDDDNRLSRQGKDTESECLPEAGRGSDDENTFRVSNAGHYWLSAAEDVG